MTFAVAAQKERLPNIEIPALCSGRATALGDLGVLTTDATNSCIKSEQEAWTALLAAWKDIPPSYKRYCIRPDDYAASYAEWIACLELEIDMENLHSNK